MYPNMLFIFSGLFWLAEIIPFRMRNLVREFVCKGLALADGRLL